VVRGELTQAIGRSRGGRTTKIHALTDSLCRPIAFLLTGGQVADCIAADTLLDYMPEATILHGDKGYDSDAVRRKIESKARRAEYPAKGQSTLEELLLALSLPRPQRHRAHVRAHQGLP
jgi:transposase